MFLFSPTSTQVGSGGAEEARRIRRYARAAGRVRGHEGEEGRIRRNEGLKNREIEERK